MSKEVAAAILTQVYFQSASASQRLHAKVTGEGDNPQESLVLIAHTYQRILDKLEDWPAPKSTER